MKRGKFYSNGKVELARFGLGGADKSELIWYHYEKGEYLCREGEPLVYFQVITQGTVKISVTASNGKTLLFCFDKAGDVIGSIELMGGLTYNANAQAVTPVSCLALAAGPNMHFFKNDVPFLNYLCAELGRAFNESSKNNAFNILHPLQTRLCAYILMTAEGDYFTENLTAVSELLGTSYRHLLRVLASLQKENALQKVAGGYNIANRALMQALAAG